MCNNRDFDVTMFIVHLSFISDLILHAVVRLEEMKYPMVTTQRFMLMCMYVGICM